MRIIIFCQYSVKTSNRLNVFYLFFYIAFLFSLKLHDSIFYEVQKTVFRKNYVQNSKTSKNAFKKHGAKTRLPYFTIYTLIFVFLV